MPEDSARNNPLRLKDQVANWHKTQGKKNIEHLALETPPSWLSIMVMDMGKNRQDVEIEIQNNSP